MHLSNSQMNAGTTGAISHSSRMVLQREQITLWQMISQPCSLRQNYHLHFWEKLSVPKSMSGIVFLHPLSRVPLPMRSGSSANQMSPIFAFGDAWHMSSFRRTTTAFFNPTWNNPFFLFIPVVTKAGSSTIPLQRSISSLNGLNLMNVSFQVHSNITS